MEKYFALVLIPAGFALAAAGLMVPELSSATLLAMFLAALIMLSFGCSLWRASDLYWQ